MTAQGGHRAATLARLGGLRAGLSARSQLSTGGRGAGWARWLLFMLLNLGATASWAQSALLSYPIATPHSFPTRIALDKEGSIWFIASNTHRLGRFDPASGTFSEHAIPTPSSFPADLAVGVGGKVWVAESHANQLAVFDPSTQVWKEFDIPTIESLPSRLALDQKGRVWFTEFYGNKVGMFDPLRQSFREYPIARAASRPAGIAVDRQGVVWFVQTQGNALTRLDPRSGKMLEFALPTPFETPRDLAIDAKGVVWFGGHIGRNLLAFYPEKRKFLAHPLPRGGVIESLAIAPDGKIYFTLKTSSKIGVFNPQSADFLELDAEVGKSRPAGIGVDARGDIWYADTERNTLSKLLASAVAKLWLK